MIRHRKSDLRRELVTDARFGSHRDEIVTATDDKNIAFWDELCGTTLAKYLGIADDSKASLKKFDDWYFDFYPYLNTHIPFGDVAGRKVLEIGLGYGTVAEKLMESGALYHGLDIAAGPVQMARHRAALLGKSADIRQGSALINPHPDATFDHVITIGCLHHTGDLAQALREVHRVLKPGGRTTIMVYNALSYRQWFRSPFTTYRRRTNPDFSWSNVKANLRKAYDVDQEGNAAPSTTFITPKEARIFLGQLFRTVRVTPRNIGEDFGISRLMPRATANRIFESRLGLDLYIECIK